MKYEKMQARIQQIEDLRDRIEFLSMLKKMSPEKIVITEGSHPTFNSITLDGDRLGFLEECFASIQSLCDDHIIMAKHQIALLESDSLGMPTVGMGKKLVTKEARETARSIMTNIVGEVSRTFTIPENAKNYHCTYDIEE